MLSLSMNKNCIGIKGIRQLKFGLQEIKSLGLLNIHGLGPFEQKCLEELSMTEKELNINLS